ncbi:hypothetical protein AFLA_007816 [Aspergillus flavus NRRL3357]|nr:hypothetical protein AFLA_007816 [Aspergillus flavus NRRL3357]
MATKTLTIMPLRPSQRLSCRNEHGEDIPNIRFGLLVGVGGGAPRTADAENTWNGIRLGDVVVSNPKGSHGGVLHYDADKFKDNGVFHITSHLNRPPSLLLTATQKLLSDHDSELGQMGNYISQVCSRLARLPALRASRFPGWDRDQLFISSYKHTGEGDCSKWDRAYLVKRLDRESDIPVVHYGLIASGSAVMRSAQRQDQLRDEWDNKEWEPYAAITAAAYAKDLLRVIHPETVEGTANVVGSLNDVSRALDKGDLEVSQLTTSVDKIHEEQKNTNILERLHLHDFNAEQSEASSESREVTGEWLLVLVGKRKCTGFSP